MNEDNDYMEENLDDHPQEKQICFRKMHFRNKLTSTSGKVNLYDILGLRMEVVRKLNIDDQKIAIKKAFHDQMKIWHPDKNCGDDEVAVKIIVAKEILLDDERRACYNNEADYDKGWFSLKRYKAIFWPDCYTEEQNTAYWTRIGLMASSFGLALGGILLTSLTAGAAAPASLACGVGFGAGLTGAGMLSGKDTISKDSVVHGCYPKTCLLKAVVQFVSNIFTDGAADVGVVGVGIKMEEGTAEETQKAMFSYESEGAWISKMIVTCLLNGEQIKEEVSSSGIVKIPSDARQVKVRFQVRRPAWGDIMKYDRFKKKWCKPPEPHVFCYEKPPLERTFTISGNLWWEAVMRVSDEHHKETGEMGGNVCLMNVKSAGKCLTFMLVNLFFPLFLLYYGGENSIELFCVFRSNVTYG